MDSKKRKGNIRTQIAFSMVLVTFILIGLIFIVNTRFLGTYYEDYKQKQLYDAFVQFSEADNEDMLYSDDYRVTFEKLCSDRNLQVAVMTAGGEAVLSSQGQNNLLFSQFYRMLFGEKEEVIRQGENYSIERQHDDRMVGDYLLLWGTLPDNNSIIIRTAVESINDSVRLSTRFLLVAGVISIAISIIMATGLSKLITRPIGELSDISRRMEQLDFEARYKTREHPNEIDELGERMNRMSETLRDTIGQLKAANADLNRDLKVRRENEKMRRDFLSDVSHELKTPLALIRGYAEGLSESVNEDEESRSFYCEVIMEEAERMNKIVMQLLSLNKLEFGEDVMHPERIDLVSVVRGVMERNKILFEQKGINAVYNGPDSCFVWSDDFATEQVITNYITNAINHCEGEKRIEVTVESDDESGTRLSVFNTGEHIPEESMGRIWDKFYKVDEARTREYGGSGIGLSIVSAIAESLGATRGAVNDEGGVTFFITFAK